MNTRLLARPGQLYAAYLPKGGSAKLTLTAGNYRMKWFNPRSGVWSKNSEVKQNREGQWTSPIAGDAGDWVLLLEAK